MATGSNQEQIGIVENSTVSNQENLTTTNTAAASPGSSLLQLPRLYFLAVFRPSVATYRSFEGQASWSLVGAQLILWAILDAVLGVLVNIISSPAGGSAFSRFYTLATSYGLVLVVPALFFLVMGIVYLVAKALKGQGTFLEQCNVFLYVGVPLGIGSKLLALIPNIGRYLNIILSLYGIVLLVLVVMAVHRPGKASK
jgi:hypothetical protein